MGDSSQIDPREHEQVVKQGLDEGLVCVLFSIGVFLLENTCVKGRGGEGREGKEGEKQVCPINL